jgi:hypothetical protein
MECLPARTSANNRTIALGDFIANPAKADHARTGRQSATIKKAGEFTQIDPVVQLDLVVQRIT